MEYQSSSGSRYAFDVVTQSCQLHNSLARKMDEKCANILLFSTYYLLLLYRPGSIFLVNGQRSNDQMIFGNSRNVWNVYDGVPRVTHHQRNNNTQERDAIPKKDFIFIASAEQEEDFDLNSFITIFRRYK